MADKEKDAEHASLPGSQDASSSNANAAGQQPRGMVPPEIIRNMTPEHREKVEKRLKRKIDGRLLPTIIIMYILNYIDRYAPSDHAMLLVATRGLCLRSGPETTLRRPRLPA